MRGLVSQVPPGFTMVRQGGTRLVVREELAGLVRRALGSLYHAWSRIAQRRFTARGRAGVVSIPLGDGHPNMIVRPYKHGGMLADVTRDLYLGPARALEELAVTEAARAGGVCVPGTIGVLLTCAAWPFWRLAMMTEEISDSEDLIHYCCRMSEYPPETAALEKRGVIGEAARQIRMMHDLGITHADLHLKNLLLRRRMAGTPQVYIIDFDRAGLGPPLTPQQRFRNLKRLARSVRKVFVANAALTAWDHVRFLRAYFRGQPEARRLLRDWARRLARSGSHHEIWWTMTGAKRSLRGDRIGRTGNTRSGS